MKTKNISILLTICVFLSIAAINVEKVYAGLGDPCTPPGVCGTGSGGGGLCAAGEFCNGFGDQICRPAVPADGCSQICTPNQCGDGTNGCPPGKKCSSDGTVCNTPVPPDACVAATCGSIGACGGDPNTNCPYESACTSAGCQTDTACPTEGNLPNGYTCTAGTQCTSGYCSPSSHLCATVVAPPPGSPPIFTGDTIDIGVLFGALASILIPGGIALALIRIAWAGYEFMISEGNPQKVAEAREDLTAAIVGALFILLSVVIFSVILKSFLGDPGF